MSMPGGACTGALFRVPYTCWIPRKPSCETGFQLFQIFLKKGVDKTAGFGYYYQRRLSGHDTNGV
jgi:hypothetical protein